MSTETSSVTSSPSLSDSLKNRNASIAWKRENAMKIRNYDQKIRKQNRKKLVIRKKKENRNHGMHTIQSRYAKNVRVIRATPTSQNQSPKNMHHMQNIQNIQSKQRHLRRKCNQIDKPKPKHIVAKSYEYGNPNVLMWMKKQKKSRAQKHKELNKKKESAIKKRKDYISNLNKNQRNRAKKIIQRKKESLKKDTKHQPKHVDIYHEMPNDADDILSPIHSDTNIEHQTVSDTCSIGDDSHANTEPVPSVMIEEKELYTKRVKVNTKRHRVRMKNNENKRYNAQKHGVTSVNSSNESLLLNIYDCVQQNQSKRKVKQKQKIKKKMKKKIKKSKTKLKKKENKADINTESMEQRLYVLKDTSTKLQQRLENIAQTLHFTYDQMENNNNYNNNNNNNNNYSNNYNNNNNNYNNYNENVNDNECNQMEEVLTVDPNFIEPIQCQDEIDKINVVFNKLQEKIDIDYDYTSSIINNHQNEENNILNIYAKDLIYSNDSYSEITESWEATAHPNINKYSDHFTADYFGDGDIIPLPDVVKHVKEHTPPPQAIQETLQCQSKQEKSVQIPENINENLYMFAGEDAPQKKEKVYNNIHKSDAYTQSDLIPKQMGIYPFEEIDKTYNNIHNEQERDYVDIDAYIQSDAIPKQMGIYPFEENDKTYNNIRNEQERVHEDIAAYVGSDLISKPMDVHSFEEKDRLYNNIHHARERDHAYIDNDLIPKPIGIHPFEEKDKTYNNTHNEKERDHVDIGGDKSMYSASITDRLFRELELLQDVEDTALKLKKLRAGSDIETQKNELTTFMNEIKTEMEYIQNKKKENQEMTQKQTELIKNTGFEITKLIQQTQNIQNASNEQNQENQKRNLELLQLSTNILTSHQNQNHKEKQDLQQTLNSAMQLLDKYTQNIHNKPNNINNESIDFMNHQISDPLIAVKETNDTYSTNQQNKSNDINETTDLMPQQIPDATHQPASDNKLSRPHLFTNTSSSLSTDPLPRPNSAPTPKPKRARGPLQTDDQSNLAQQFVQQSHREHKHPPLQSQKANVAQIPLDNDNAQPIMDDNTLHYDHDFDTDSPIDMDDADGIPSPIHQHANTGDRTGSIPSIKIANEISNDIQNDLPQKDDQIGAITPDKIPDESQCAKQEIISSTLPSLKVNNEEMESESYQHSLKDISNALIDHDDEVKTERTQSYQPMQHNDHEQKSEIIASDLMCDIVGNLWKDASILVELRSNRASILSQQYEIERSIKKSMGIFSDDSKMVINTDDGYIESYISNLFKYHNKSDLCSEIGLSVFNYVESTSTQQSKEQTHFNHLIFDTLNEILKELKIQNKIRAKPTQKQIIFKVKKKMNKMVVCTTEKQLKQHFIADQSMDDQIRLISNEWIQEFDNSSEWITAFNTFKNSMKFEIADMIFEQFITDIAHELNQIERHRL